MDPQQRLLLQQAGEALAAAGPAEAAAGPGTAVMVGIGAVEYTGLAAHLGASNYAATGARPCSPDAATLKPSPNEPSCGCLHEHDYCAGHLSRSAFAA
jgi:acyl transferase domain-containing protein